MTKAIRASSCPNHTLGSKPIFLPPKACHILVSLRHTVFILLPGMLLAYETRDCICSLQEDPLFDTHPSSICQSFFWQGELVFAPMKVKRESLTHSNSNFFFQIQTFKWKICPWKKTNSRIISFKQENTFENSRQVRKPYNIYSLLPKDLNDSIVYHDFIADVLWWEYFSQSNVRISLLSRHSQTDQGGEKSGNSQGVKRTIFSLLFSYGSLKLTSPYTLHYLPLK